MVKKLPETLYPALLLKHHDVPTIKNVEKGPVTRTCVYLTNSKVYRTGSTFVCVSILIKGCLHLMKKSQPQ